MKVDVFDHEMLAWGEVVLTGSPGAEQSHTGARGKRKNVCPYIYPYQNIFPCSEPSRKVSKICTIKKEGSG